MKTQWSEAEIHAAGRTVIEKMKREAAETGEMSHKSMNEFHAGVMIELTNPKLRDDCPVLYDLPEGTESIPVMACSCPEWAVNVRPLITLDGAREIAYGAISRYMHAACDIEDATQYVHEALEAHVYGHNPE